MKTLIKIALLSILFSFAGFMFMYYAIGTL